MAYAQNKQIFKLFFPFGACAFALWAQCALATEARGELEYYDYRELLLVRTIPSGKAGLACFVTPQDKPVWAHQGDYVGKEFGVISEIAQDSITVKEKLLVNFGEWVDRYFEWPVGNSQGLSALCAKPPGGLQPGKPVK